MLQVFQCVMPTTSCGVEFQWFSLILSPPVLESPGMAGACDECVLIDRDPDLLPLLHALVHNRLPQSSLCSSIASDPNSFANAAPVTHRHQCALCEARNQWLFRCEAPSCNLLVCGDCIGDIPGRPGMQRCVRCLRQGGCVPRATGAPATT